MTSIAASGDVVVAAIGVAVYLSADGGVTWTVEDTGLPETGTVDVYAFDGAFLLLHAELTGAQRLRDRKSTRLNSSVALSRMPSSA